METTIGQFKQLFRILKHPVDGFWELRYESRGSWWSATILLLAACVVSFVSNLTTNYIFHPVEIKFIDPFSIVLKVMVPFLSWVVSNYMVSAIKHGQGRFIDVFIGSAYALGPYILFAIPLAVISNALTLSEGVLYTFGNDLIAAWCVFLFFVSVKEIHNYELGETIFNIVLSLIFMILLWFIFAVFVGLNTQLAAFINQIIEEVSIR